MVYLIVGWFLEIGTSFVKTTVYKQPRTTTGTIELSQGTELWEYLCVRSESEEFNADDLRPEVGAN